jgi:hypothetical protein
MGDKGSTEEEGEQAEAAEASKRIRVEERRVEESRSSRSCY